MKTDIYGIDGKKQKQIDLPEVFCEKVMPKLIIRAFTAHQSKSLQPHGTDPTAGLKSTAEYIGRRNAFRTGINRAMSRLPRIKTGGGGLGHVRKVPHAVGGRRAHPPKVEKVLEKKLNKKEKKLAMRSAIAATAKTLVVIEDKFQDVKKTQEAVKVIGAVGLEKDLERGQKKKIRAGKQTKRGKKYKKAKSLLIVVAKGKKNKSCTNLPGVDIATADKLNVGLLAPGSHAGRRVLWTETAIKEVGEKYGC